MTQPLTNLAVTALVVVLTSAAVWVVHRLLVARLRLGDSTGEAAWPTALKNLEFRGGRHRIHAQLIETLFVEAAAASATGAFLSISTSHATPSGAITAGAGAVIVALWWSYRRGTFRDAEVLEPSIALTTTGTTDRGIT